MLYCQEWHDWQARLPTTLRQGRRGDFWLTKQFVSIYFVQDCRLFNLRASDNPMGTYDKLYYGAFVAIFLKSQTKSLQRKIKLVIVY